MSADDWSRCPRCYARDVAAFKQATKSHENGYGKMTREEFEASARLEAHRKAPEWDNEDDYSLREDYSFQIGESFDVVVIYSAKCQRDRCRFSYRHEHQENIGKRPAA